MITLEWVTMENYLELVPALAPLIDNFKKKAKSNLRTKDIQNGMLRTLVDPNFKVLVARNEEKLIGYSIIQIGENPPWLPRTVKLLQGYCTPGYPEATDIGLIEIERFAREIGAARIIGETKRFGSLHGFQKRLHLAPMTACVVKDLTKE